MSIISESNEYGFLLLFFMDVFSKVTLFFQVRERFAVEQL